MTNINIKQYVHNPDNSLLLKGYKRGISVVVMGRDGRVNKGRYKGVMLWRYQRVMLWRYQRVMLWRLVIINLRLIGKFFNKDN